MKNPGMRNAARLKEHAAQELFDEECPEGHPLEVGHPKNGISFHRLDLCIFDHGLRRACVYFRELDIDIGKVADQEIVQLQTVVPLRLVIGDMVE